jgi:hypothetical protein
VTGVGAAAIDAGAPSLTSSGWTLEDGDDHCEIVAASHSPAAVAAAGQHHVVLSTLDAPSPPIAAFAPAAAVLYLLAPKTSPPA